jgi:NhaP-type Na+/H+ and K+/H+ antiporter
LLAAFAVTHHVHDAARIYETVFVVVLASVVVQGGTIPAAARRLTRPAERAG